MKNAILKDSYIHFDETYHKILGGDKDSMKWCFWIPLSHESNLIQFILEYGSRSKKVFTNYLPGTYKGAVQTDGYSLHKILEEFDYL